MLNRQVHHLHRQIADEREISVIRKIIEEQTAFLSQLESQLNDISSKTASMRTKMEQSNSTLYGKANKSPKELQDLQMEIASLGKHLPPLEEQELDLMVSVEAEQQKLSILQGQLKTSVEFKAKSHLDFEDQIAIVTKEIEKLTVERDATSKSVPQDALALYTRIQQVKSGIAVVEVIDSGCSSCGAEISKSEWQEARTSTTLIYCQGCGRIIYGN
ncbi:MAG: hypothetical protein C0391_04875 [Anaerolinea sp.]|nr:hypothetical protein [Anaerolinea sp.]